MPYITKLNKQYITRLVKILIALLCFIFLYRKFKNINITEFDDLILLNLENSWHLPVLAIVLFFANWGIEAAKWKFLIRKFQNISFFKAFAAVLGGVAVSSFTPNRTGEFAGRMLFLNQKLNAGIITLTIFGSLSQLFITIVAGLPGFYMFFTEFDFLDFNKIRNFTIAIILFLIVVILLLAINFKKIKDFSRNHFTIKKVLTRIKNALLMLDLSEILLVFSLSFVRYMVFLLQFILLLFFFRINLETSRILMLLPTIFLIQTIIPSFLLSEIGIRVSVAIAVLSPLGFAEKNIIASSTSLWIINIMLAAIAGAFTILFFKPSKK